MNNLYDVLETCLQEMENGVELEKILAHYPDLAAELHPLLQAARTAKLVAVPAPSRNILLRNQVKFLQGYDQIADAKRATRSGFQSLRLVTVTFVLLVVFFFSGTSMVRASFDALPGDSLYSVKRSWEDITLSLTFDTQARDQLETKYEQERLNEISQLFAIGRAAPVDFVGVVTRQLGEEWRVDNVLVIVSAQTHLPGQPIHVGALVRVFGTAKGEGYVLADRIELLTIVTPRPNVIGTPPAETDESSAGAGQNPGNSGSPSETETPGAEEPDPTATPKIESFEGILVAMDQHIWKIDTTLVNIDQAEIIGIPGVGARVKAKGYFEIDGIFIALKLEILDTSSGDNNENLNTNDDGNSVNNSNENAVVNGDDDSNSNDNHDGGGDGGGVSNDNGG